MDSNLALKFLAVVSCKALVVGYAQYAGTFTDLTAQPMAMPPSDWADVDLPMPEVLVVDGESDVAPMAQKKALP
jgi:hypothetical protein